MCDQMIKRLIEGRIQNIIDVDKTKNKQMAIKTKVLNTKLQQYGEFIGASDLIEKSAKFSFQVE